MRLSGKDGDPSCPDTSAPRSATMPARGPVVASPPTTGSSARANAQGPPPSVPTRPADRADPLPLIRTTGSDFGFWIGFWNWNWAGAHRPGSQGIGRWGPARSKRADGTRKLGEPGYEVNVGAQGKRPTSGRSPSARELPLTGNCATLCPQQGHKDFSAHHEAGSS